MNTALTSTGKQMKDHLDLRFGRCRFFLFYDLDKGLLKSVENNGESSGGGAGIAAAQQIIDEDVEIVITGHMGPNAFKLMETSKIKVYQGKEISCEEVMTLFKEGKLPEITQAGPAHRGMSI